MNEQGFPNGWNEQRVKELIAELDAPTDEEWIAADEAAADDGGDQTVITYLRACCLTSGGCSSRTRSASRIWDIQCLQADPADATDGPGIRAIRCLRSFQPAPPLNLDVRGRRTLIATASGPRLRTTIAVKSHTSGNKEKS